MLKNALLKRYRRFRSRVQIVQRKLRLQKKLPHISRDFNKLNKKYTNDILAYWKNITRISLNWHMYYSFQNSLQDVHYIPEDIFYAYIEPHYNRLELVHAYRDKAIYDILFPALNRPTTLVRNLSGVCYDDTFSVLTKEEALARCIAEDAVILKPSIQSGGGRNVRLLQKSENMNYEQDILNSLDDMGMDYVVQMRIIQHPNLSEIHANSVNTIRVISFFHQGTIHILSSIFRVGAHGAYVDNINSGGIFVGIYPDGRLKPTAYGKDGKQYSTHPQGFEFSNGRIPNYQGILDVIRREHVRFGHFKLISWDFSVDQHAQPVFIEYNLIWQEINSHQICNGPLFGDMTNEVLREVFSNRRIKK